MPDAARNRAEPTRRSSDLLQAQQEQQAEWQLRRGSLQAQEQQSMGRLSERLAPLGLNVQADSDLQQLQREVHAQIERWQQNEARQQQLQQQIQPLEVEIRGVQREYQTRNEEKQRVEAALKQIGRAAWRER